MSDLVYSFQRHTSGQARVANERDNVEIFAFQIARGRDAQRRRNRSPSVGGVEHVVFRLFSAQETADSIVLPDGGKLIPTAGDDLVRVGLVTDVKHQLVARRI